MILTLPYIFSLLGMASGIIFQLFFASLALYTNYLLMALHTEYRHIINTDPKHLKHGDKNHIVSYYGKMFSLALNYTFTINMTYLYRDCVIFGGTSCWNVCSNNCLCSVDWIVHCTNYFNQFQQLYSK